MKKVIFIATFGALLFSCSDDPWTKYEKKEFLQGCELENGGSFYCKCLMEKMMEKYPIYEDSHNISLEEAVELASKCQ